MRRSFLALALLLLLAPGSVLAYTSPGSAEGYVTDFADILTPETESTLEAELSQFNASTTIEIAVVTVNSLNDEDVAVYANELFREWGIGKKATNNGLLLLVAPNEREMRIEVGYGLEGAVPDITAGRIVDDIITPAFKGGDYAGGIVSGVRALEAVSQGESFPSPQNSDADGFKKFMSDTGYLPAILLFVLFQMFALLAAIFARSKSWWLGGVVGSGLGVLALILSASAVVGVGLIVVLGLFGLLFDYLVSKSYKKFKSGGPTPPWFYGGSSGFGGGSFGGGGGFGGGSSGGGGASGSW